MKKGKRALVLLLIAGLLLVSLASCGSEEEEYRSEGEDTKIEITGYNAYPDGHDYFLKEGDKVAVISPSELPSREQVDAVLEGLEGWGYVPVEGKYVCPEVRTMEEQIEDLTWALNDPEIKAIYCVRGGYASAEVMDTIGLEPIKKAGKPIIGYSDITVYHSAWTMAGVPSIHASMSATFMDLPEECAEVQQHMMMGEIPSYKCETEFKGINGEAEGILVGGNLSTFVTVLQTAYDCTTMDEPYILFLEDVDDNIREIHRYLTILDHCGALDRAAGIIFGEFTMLPADDEANFGVIRGGLFESVAEMITRQFLADRNIPVAFGFPAGHGDVNYPLLMGEPVHLNVTDDSYTIDWVGTKAL